MFGRGLCEPVDDLEAGATHPELLEMLGKAFAKSGYDLKAIQRAIALSKTYGLSSVPNESNAEDTDGYSRSYLRPMPPEALFSSLIAATGADQAAPAPAPSANRRDRRAGRARRAAGRNRINLRQRMQLLQRFVFTFDDDEATEALDYESSIPQALMFLNGDLVNRGVQAGASGLLAEELAGRKDDAARVTLLFLKALGRTPDEQEQKMVQKLLRAAGGDETARREVFEDTFWALLNSSEFFFNH